MPETINKNPLISVIIPIYNVDKYLEKSLYSIMNQSMVNIEIICVDDKSTDNSFFILENFAKNDSRIKVLQHDQNLGVSCARNTGLKLARADYLMFLDPDDYVEPNFCEEMYKAINNTSYDLVVCNVNIKVELDMRGRNRGFTNDRDYTNIKSSWVWNKIWKRDIVNKYKIQFPEKTLGEDAYFKNCYYAISNQNVNFINERLYTYLIRSDSLMSAFDSKDNEVVFDCFKIAEITYDFYKKHNKLNNVYQHYFKSLNIAFKYLTEKNYDRMAEIIYQSLKTKPEIKIFKDSLEVGDLKNDIPNKIMEKILILKY